MARKISDHSQNQFSIFNDGRMSYNKIPFSSSKVSYYFFYMLNKTKPK